MTIVEIKAAVDAGLTVHWANTGYQVLKDSLGQYLITFLPNGSSIGLTDWSGRSLDGKEEQFFVAIPEREDELSGIGPALPDGAGEGCTPVETEAHSSGRQPQGQGQE